MEKVMLTWIVLLGLLTAGVLSFPKSRKCENTTRSAKSLTKKTNAKAGQPVDWYTCTSQGNYPDPRTCENYIACTAANTAYQMPCPEGPDGTLLHYVRTSGPDEQKSYCDTPENAGCAKVVRKSKSRTKC